MNSIDSTLTDLTPVCSVREPVVLGIRTHLRRAVIRARNASWPMMEAMIDRLIETNWLSDTDLGALRSLGSRRALPAGATLFLEGDDPYDLMVIESGDVKLTTMALNGNETVLEVLGGGEVLGELSAIDGAPRSATAVALTPVELTSIPVGVFLEFLRAHPSAMGALLAVAVRRLRLSNRRQLEFSTSDALGRVCGRLDELADRYGQAGDTDEVHIDLAINQTELAQWCGLSREAVVKALRKLRDLGWVSTADGAVTVLNRSALSVRGRL